MYLNILKRDLKRKKTMNLILLLFITLAVMFVSSSVNMLLTVTNAIDTNFEKAGITDYFIANPKQQPDGRTTEEALKEIQAVDKYYSEDCLGVGYFDSALIHGNNSIELGSGLVTPFEQAHLKYFDSENREITRVADDEIYLLGYFMNENNIEPGDRVTLKIGDTSKDFTVKGEIKDALFGSALMGTPRFIINQHSYNEYPGSDSSWQLIYIECGDAEALKTALGDMDITFNADKAMLRTTYIMDMLIAAVLLVLSVCLILISFLILRFTIGFTLSEEYREIGIMKAIGIKNVKIRGLYLVKYFAMSVAGAVVGVICGIPFGDMFIRQASQNIMITSDGNYLTNIICALGVIAIVMLFCYTCTGRVKKFSPVDAIRNGSGGERYGKKGFMRLGRSHTRPAVFMALNDILCNIKRYLTMVVTFTVGILLIIMITDTLNTLKSDSLIPLFSMAHSDVYMEDSGAGRYLTSDGREMMENKLSDIKAELKKRDIEADCFCEVMFKFSIEKDGFACQSSAFQGINTTTDMYEYMEGSAPENTNEVAITHIIADNIHAKIGDTVTITTAQGSEKYIVTAIYQSMNNFGEGIRLHEDVDLDCAQLVGFFCYQIKYTDNPTEREIAERMKLIKEMYPRYEVMNGSEFADKNTGGVAEYMGSLKAIIIGVVMLICILVAVLMEKSFLTKEKSDIAMLKATGFKNGSVILWQTLRIAVVMLISAVLAIALSPPAERLAIVPVFNMMGAYNIAFDINVLEAYVAYPLAVIAVTVFAVFLTARQVCRVSSSEINNIE